MRTRRNLVKEWGGGARTGAVRDIGCGAPGAVADIVGWCAPGAVADIVVRSGVESTVIRCAPRWRPLGGFH
ncbi:hypothetical protein [Streptomyces sp. NBC_01431]|uniref:hypothetical protein n=1 Tax=Streptomyces sp. NBC_01431 TaxID=2903863 RepID=UPI002E2F870D|nr:hypothetical protein [Streptomyces sp. NBC_01431]